MIRRSGEEYWRGPSWSDQTTGIGKNSGIVRMVSLLILPDAPNIPDEAEGVMSKPSTYPRSHYHASARAEERGSFELHYSIH